MNRRRLRIAVLLASLAAGAAAGRSLWPPSVRPAAEWSALTGVTVVNPGRPPLQDQTLLLRDGRIESMRGGVSPQSLMPRWRQFRGRYVLPGLIDLDVRPLPSIGHLQQLFGLLFLYNGVTTTRVLGTVDGKPRQLQARIDAGEIAWPRLVACGRLLEGDPPQCASSRVVGDAAEATRAVDELAASGAACIAVHWTLSPAAFAAVRAAAAGHGLAVVGDPPPAAGAEQAAIADRHLLAAVPPAGSGETVDDFLATWADADTAAIQRLVAAATTQPTAYVPNLFRWSRLLVGEEQRGGVPGQQFMPRFYRDVFWPHALANLRVRGAERSAAAVTSLHRATAALQQAGVTLRAGSGAASPFVAPGFGTWLEMLQLVGAGATLEQMWIAATRQAGAATGIPQLGVIAEGAPADLLIFREDPTRDAAALQTLEAVITQGRLYQQPGLNRSLLEMTRYFEAPLYDALSMAMARVMVWGSPQRTAACEAP